ncbi:hypothetical protein H0H92_014726 [Tricholoma furcatifolium]|nr:hypothetical protein H0H92_014726 [Tricholoma furcatifolium]
MHHTAWAKSSSLPSDRLRPKPGPAITRPKNSKTPEPAVPQSKALRNLNALRASLQDPSTGTTMDPTGGCFCQARTHPLSTYVPMCTSCALPLCNLAAPAHLCPSCKEPLLTLSARTSLLLRVESEISETTIKEQLARERAEQERIAAAGAFPTLSSTASSAYPTPSHSQSPSPRPAPPPQPQSHKVLTLGSTKGKKTKTVLTTTTVKPGSATPSPHISRPSSPQPTREPRPDANLDSKGKGKERVNTDRPWENLSGDTPVYVPPMRSVDDAEAGDQGENQKGRRRRRGKGKGKDTVSGEGIEDVQVGSSAAVEGSGS